MKRFTIILSFLFVVSLVMAQVQTIHDPNVQSTVTQDEINAWKQAGDQQGSRSVTVLNFEGLFNQEEILNFYNGGTGSLGNSGTNYGVSFSPSGLAIIDADAGGTGNIANEPSPNTVLFWLTEGSTTMNVPSGFEGAFSLKYSANTTNGSFTIYSGLNGTGSVLASASLSQNYDLNCSGDPNGAYCHWDLVSVTVGGIAHSVVFSGTSNLIAFDDVTFENIGVVPVANWALFLGIGLILAFTVIRLRKIF